jgi:intracellular sulfur oxidation DsrE/DsrF family protein
MMKSNLAAVFCGAVFLASNVNAGPEAFREGALIEGYGKIADVPDAAAIPKDALFKVSWDLAKAAESGEVNRGLDTVARFMNMHHAAGIPVKRLQLAVVVHGGAYRDLLSEAAYGGANPNAPLIDQLVAHGVQVILCGQTAAWYGVTGNDLLPGVTLSLSAMTAHALLQQQGYSLNPF